MSDMHTWAAASDAALARVFDKAREEGRQPTRKELAAAYPFGPRKYWPYKAWLARRKAWLAAAKAGLSRPARNSRRTPSRRATPDWPTLGQRDLGL